MKAIRVIIALLLTVCTVLSFTLVKNKLLEVDEYKRPAEYKGILTIWHVETFEGGTGSRKQFLLKCARSFEKKNKGVLVMVINHTKNSLEQALKEDELPDMISFGQGVSVKGAHELNIKRKVKGGMVGEKTYATAWAKGGYVLIGNALLVQDFPKELPTLIVSQTEYTQPLTALVLEGINAQEVQIKKPMDAYVEFVGGKTPYFLGTQRDISRLENRGMEVITKQLSQYNDIYQYISVTAQNEQRALMSKNFIEYLVGDSAQSKLPQIKMLSPFIKCKYDNEHLSNMQLDSENWTLSAFTSLSDLSQMQSLAIKANNGDEASKNKIKNIAIKS